MFWLVFRDYSGLFMYELHKGVHEDIMVKVLGEPVENFYLWELGSGSQS